MRGGRKRGVRREASQPLSKPKGGIGGEGRAGREVAKGGRMLRAAARYDMNTPAVPGIPCLASMDEGSSLTQVNKGYPGVHACLDAPIPTYGFVDEVCFLRGIYFTAG